MVIRFIRFFRYLKRVLGIQKRPPEPEGEYGSAAEDLRSAADAKSNVSDTLHSVADSGSGDAEHLNEIARRKREDAGLLRQLAAELEIGRSEWR